MTPASLRPTAHEAWVLHAWTIGALCLGIAWLTATPQVAGGHPLAPALLELTEERDGEIHVLWRTSPWRPIGANVEPILPTACRPASSPETVDGRSRREQRWTVQCDGGLIGQTVGIADLDVSQTNAIVRIALADGRVLQSVVDRRRPSIVVTARSPALEVARDYARLGVEHIAFGVDHLLFVFGLLLLVRGPRQLVATVTAFTLGHSATLAAAVLGYARLPSAPVEVLIALTLLYLAVELAGDAQRETWARRRPWLMAASFGLLHGLGFAGALREIGLPEGDVPLALVAFNVGIELGQLAFVLVVAGVAWGLRPLSRRIHRRLAQAPVYGMGTLAAFWSYERAADLWR